MTIEDSAIARRFSQHGVRFYHAENLRHFRAYCRSSALLCRKQIINSVPGHTAFYSDDTDQKLGVLNRVFGNLYDFGSVFARADLTVPNIYGPIMLVFSPQVYSIMSDVCITKKSVATLRDSWRNASVRSETEMDLLLAGDRYGSPISKDYQSCEVSCSNATISLKFLEEIIVEPVSIHGRLLHDLVLNTCKYAGINCPVIERQYRSKENRDLLCDLSILCDRLMYNSSQKEWISPESQLPKAFDRYPSDRRNRVCLWVKYFFFGTTQEVADDLLIDDIDDDRTVCAMCNPGEERPPALVNYSPLVEEGATESRIDIGYCDWCNGISVKCKQCNEVNSVYDYEYGKPICCSGECGLCFRVECSYDSRDGCDSVHIEILPDAMPKAWNGIGEH